MHRLTRTFAQGVFALGTIASLGFGAQQAVASQTDRAAGSVCEFGCDSDCIAKGYNYGYCVDGQCVCRMGP